VPQVLQVLKFIALLYKLPNLSLCCASYPDELQENACPGSIPIGTLFWIINEWILSKTDLNFNVRLLDPNNSI
jgi:hypothetical protein